MQTRTCCPSAHVLVTTALLRALIFRGGQRSRLRTSSSHTASPKYASVTGFVWRTTWSTSRSAAEQCGAAMRGRARPWCNPAGAVEKEATPRRELRACSGRAALAMLYCPLYTPSRRFHVPKRLTQLPGFFLFLSSPEVAVPLRSNPPPPPRTRVEDAASVLHTPSQSIPHLSASRGPTPTFSPPSSVSPVAIGRSPPLTSRVRHDADRTSPFPRDNASIDGSDDERRLEGVLRDSGQ